MEFAATNPVAPEAKVAADAERNFARSIARGVPFTEAFRKEKAFAEKRWLFLIGAIKAMQQQLK